MAKKLRFIEERTALLPPLDPQASLISENRRVFPSSDWGSSTRDHYHLCFIPGPPPSFPPVTRPTGQFGNNPHSKTVYHITKIDRKKICNVESVLLGDPDARFTPKSETMSSFDSKILPRVQRIQKLQQTTGHGIVPSSQSSNEEQERMLPVCSRDKVCKMKTGPSLTYTGKKKKLPQPYSDGGVVYSENDTTPRPSDRFWSSVTNMNGRAFSKKRTVPGPEVSLSTQFFTGSTSQEGDHEIRPVKQNDYLYRSP